MTAMLSDSQIEKFRSFYEKFQADLQQVEFYKQLDQRRLVAKEEMVVFLDSYLTGQNSTKQLKDTFDRKTRTEWNCFGFKGMSGAMFLNKLVNHISDSYALTDQLKSVLKAPITAHDGEIQMRAFLRFIEELIFSNQVTKQQIQPARTPFFISAWWHLQDTEVWPVFYPNTRQSFELEGLYISTQDPIKDYFTFRESYLSLAKALGLSSWNLEHLFAWQRQHIAKDVESDEVTEQTVAESLTSNPSSVDEQETATVTTELSQEEEDKQATSSHTHIQWLLAKIGQKLGCQVWIAMNDRNRVWQGERLGDLSLKSLPNLGMDSDSQQIISLIDVLWLKGAKAVAAAFEVEHTTSIYSGLLRMSDLVASSPNINFPLYIISPTVRLKQVRRELSRPTFQTLGLHNRCGFFSEEKLIEEANGIMRWATHPSAIDKLAAKVGDADTLD